MHRVCLVALCLLCLCLPAQADDLSTLFPDKVDDSTRVQLVTGLEAQAEVDKLHGKALQAMASAIGRYARSHERPVEVWVSRVASADEARRQTGLMVHKMFENPQSPFSHPARLEHNGVAVYRFTGMGRTHVIWFSKDLVWWISMEPEDQQRFLDVFCR